MRLLRRKCAFVLDVLGLMVVFVLVCLIVSRFWSGGGKVKIVVSFLSADDLRTDLDHVQIPRPATAVDLDDVQIPRVATAVEDTDKHCNMEKCFNVTKCRNGNFNVFVYPDQPGQKKSPLYDKILKVIRSSHYYTSDPMKACLLVPSVDTLDRDRLSRDYVQRLPEMASLQFWNDGRNHLIFNQYSGSWPNYQETLDFSTGKAILAKASFSRETFRSSFDVSLPLMHTDHRERGAEVGMLNIMGNVFPIRRKYLLAFKGKRYLYGHGGETRSLFYHIHNGRDIVLLTTCKHNTDWSKYQDERCHLDNELYEKYDYSDLLTNSSFCLVPRGRRLGSFRFLESLQASCIPVSLSNGYVLPFEEVMDWEKASLTIDERQLLQVPHIVRSIPTHDLLSMRLHTQFLWQTYFSSVERIISTTLEVIRNRVESRSKFVWNHAPGGLAILPSYSHLPTHYPFYSPSTVQHHGLANYTAVITCTKPALKGTSPLIRLIKNIAHAPHLDRIVILWSGVGPPRISLPEFEVPIIIRERALHGHLTSQFWPLEDVVTDAVLHLTESTEIIMEEAEFGFTTWTSFPDRLVGYVAHKHYWDLVHLQWSYSSRWTNEYSMVLTSAMFYHKYYGYLLSERLPPSVKDLADQSQPCLDIAVNFLVSHIIHRPPIKVTHKKELNTNQDSSVVLQKLNSDRTSCLNMVVNAYGHIPLQYSAVRMDPVLFKDNVSMLRKEYRKLESL